MGVPESMNKKYMIFGAALIVSLIIIGILLLTHVSWQYCIQENLSKNGSNERTIGEFKDLEEMEMTEKISREVSEKILNLRYSEKLTISKIDVIPEKRVIVINVSKKPSDEQISVIQNKKIENWSIKVQYDEAFQDRMIKVNNELQSLKNDSAYRIAYYYIEEYPFWENPKIWIVVFELNSKNQKLNGTKIQGWEIIKVGEVVRPPSQS
ncbi:MAG: hypothetical protein Q8O06_02715 [Acetobacterium sp.]|nr:hypothetical protein [Acetobacterium sp.]